MAEKKSTAKKEPAKKTASKPAAKKTAAKPAAKKTAAAKPASKTKAAPAKKAASAKTKPAVKSTPKKTASAKAKPAVKTTAKKPAAKSTAAKTTAKVPAKKEATVKAKAPAKKEPKNVIVHGYVEFQQPLPAIKVFENGNQIAKLKRLEKLVLGPIDKDTTLEFRTLFHKTSITIPASNPKDVQLSYNTLTGKIKAYMTDDIDELQEKLDHQDSKNRKVYIIICIAIAIALFGISIITRCAVN